MHHLCLIRGVDTAEDDHGLGRYKVLTGRTKTAAANDPEIGAVAARALMPEDYALPGYVLITPGGGGGRGSDSAHLGPKYASVRLGNGKPTVLLFDWNTQEVRQKLVTDGVERGVVWRTEWLADGSLMGVTSGANEGALLFWKTDAANDFHQLKLPSNARDMDLHPDGLHVATAHHDSHVRLTRLAAKA